jgi:hypothetical protein
MRTRLLTTVLATTLAVVAGCSSDSPEVSVDGGARVNDATGGTGSGATGTSGSEPALNPGGDVETPPNLGDPNE